MNDKKSAYRHVFKATSLFGGVQIVQILTLLIRSKFIAVFLGPAGIGVSTLLSSSLNIINTVSGLGLNFSGIREISQAEESGNTFELGKALKVMFSWLILGGLCGTLFVICFSPLLSQFSFGNNNYTWAFVCLSTTVLLNGLNNGNIAKLQALRQLSYTAKASVSGSLIGLFTSIPLYYFYGIQGIVPALIISTLTAFLVSSFYSRKVRTLDIKLSLKETLVHGQGMLKLGLVLMVSVFLGSLVTYVVNIFISHKAGVADVGLYQAGISITNQYIGLVFAAMSADYFPRLTAICNDSKKLNEMVNEQAEIVILIVAPTVLFLLLTAPLIIKILLSSEFYPIIGFVRWIALGMIFKAASYAMGYISFAKGDKVFFFYVEGLMSNFLTLILNIAGYFFGGLEGMGISFLISYLSYFLIISYLTKRRYSFYLKPKFFIIFLSLLSLCVLSFIIFLYTSSFTSYTLVTLLFLCSIYYSYRQIDKLIDIKSIINAKFNNHISHE